MADITHLTDALKKFLKSRGMTYGALARRLSISEASVKRMFSTGSFTLRRLGQICEVLELDFFDLAKLAHNKTTLESRLSIAQEEALVANRRLLLVFYLLLSEWSIGEITSRYSISKKEILRHTRELHGLKLVELGARNEVRLRTAKNIDWRHDGPMRKAYQKPLVAEFFDSEFNARHQTLRFDGKELSSSSIAVMVRKIDRLLRDFDELAEIDAPLKRTEKQSVGMILAIRPYVLSAFADLKRSAGSAPWATVSWKI
jgi:DNA-binding Xre family transcriptional regulator